MIELTYDDDRLTVEGLSRRSFASRRQLQRAFAEAGTSVRERLHAVRMERAAELLHDSSLPVSQIAHSVGYRQPAQFAKAFRRYHELAPSQWRKGINSTPTINEVISVECQCGCEAPAASQAPEVRSAPERDGRESLPDRRLEELEHRLTELEEKSLKTAA